MEDSEYHVRNNSDDAERKEDAREGEEEEEEGEEGKSGKKKFVLHIQRNPVKMSEDPVDIQRALRKFIDVKSIQIEGARELMFLCKDPAKARACVDNHVIGTLFMGLHQFPEDREARISIFGAIASITEFGLGKFVSVRSEGGIDPVLEAMDVDYFDADVQAAACDAIAHLCSHSDNRMHIIERGGGTAVVNALKCCVGSPAVAASGSRAICNMHLCELNNVRRILHDLDAVGAVVSSVGANKGDADAVADGLQCLSEFSQDFLNRKTVARCGGIGLIVDGLELHPDDLRVQQEGMKASFNATRRQEFSRKKLVEKAGHGRIIKGLYKFSADPVVVEFASRAFENVVASDERGVLTGASERSVNEFLLSCVNGLEDTQDHVRAQRFAAHTLGVITGDDRFKAEALGHQAQLVLSRSIQYQIERALDPAQLAVEDEDYVEFHLAAFQALRNCASNSLKSRQQCADDGAVEAISAAASVHAHSQEVQEAAWKVLSEYTLDCAAIAQRALDCKSVHAVCQSLINHGKNCPNVVVSACVFIANLAHAACLVDTEAMRDVPYGECRNEGQLEALERKNGMLDAIMEAEKLPMEVIRCMAAHPHDISVQEKGCRCLRLLATRRKHAKIICSASTQGMDAAVSAIAFAIEENRPKTPEGKRKKRKTKFVDGVEVEDESEMKKKKKVKSLKKGVPLALILEHAIAIIVRGCYVDDSIRRVALSLNSLEAAVAALQIAGSNPEVHRLGMLLMGIMAAGDPANQMRIWECEGVEAVAVALKKFSSNLELQWHGLWAAAVLANGNPSNQNTFVMDGGMEFCRRALSKFGSGKDSRNAFVRGWANFASKAIDGAIINPACTFWKAQYDSIDDEDIAPGIPPGSDPKEFVPEILEELTLDVIELKDVRWNAVWRIQAFYRCRKAFAKFNELKQALMERKAKSKRGRKKKSKKGGESAAASAEGSAKASGTKKGRRRKSKSPSRRATASKKAKSKGKTAQPSGQGKKKKKKKKKASKKK
eukprot:g2985.t1